MLSLGCMAQERRLSATMFKEFKPSVITFSNGRKVSQPLTNVFLKNATLLYPQGEYTMGEKLTENKIAAELKVSRTPIRDAFRQLEKEQLVEYIPNKGCFARGFSREDMNDIYAVRGAVEALAIRKACDHADEQDIRQLGRQLEKMHFYTKQNSYEKLLQANEEFHLMIYRMTESRFIVQIMKTYQDYVHLARRESLKKEEDLPEIYQEHEAIYRAIEARDKDAAAKAGEHHLEQSAT